MAKWILEASGLRMAFGDRDVLEIDRLAVYEGDRIGLIGENGAGKTTLLRTLAGEITPDEGTVRCQVPTAFIHQQGNADTEADRRTSAIFQAKGSREGRSGGEMTRNRIAEAMARHPRLLLADEPTTDLDREGIGLLRRELESFDGSLILVSHDRTLLRQICSRIWYLEDGRITDFPGGYDDFMRERTRLRERAAFEYEQYRAEKKRLQQSAQRMAERATQVRKAPARMGNSEARLHKREWTDAVLQISHAKRTIQNRIDHMEVKERPRDLPDIRMKLGLTNPVEAKVALEVSAEKLQAGKRVLLRDTGFQVPTGSRTALTGPNGCGKTTLLRTLSGETAGGITFDGRIRINPAVRIGWFDQHHERTLDPKKSVLENVLETSAQPESFARTVLACLGLAGDQVFEKAEKLSGGEKAKAALGKLMLTDCNTLILDEPTNHLDLFTMEELEKLLAGYGGTLLFVSHDEELIRKIATRIVRFEGGKLITTEGGWEETHSGQKKDAGKDALRLEMSRLEMRMAALSARMAAPKKGDRPEELKEEYMAMAAELKELGKQAAE